jgi:hypothetical protein
VVCSPGNAGAHPGKGYAVVYETSSVFTGAKATINTPDPNLGNGSLTNETIWAVDDDTCGGQSWVEGGWSKNAGVAGGQRRYKFMYLVQPSCTFTIYPMTQSPASGSTHWYELSYCTSCGSNHYWYLYIDGTWKAGVNTGWKYADHLEAGGEVAPSGVQMGTGNVWYNQYRTSTSTWYSWYGVDNWHCDPGYNAYFNVYAHSTNWGFELSSGCVQL